MHLIGLAASEMSYLSRILWCQMRLTLTSKFRVYQCCVSTHGKVSMSTRLWHLNNSIGYDKYIRFWDKDHSTGWHMYIRLWDLDHSVGWLKATRGIPREMSAKNHRPGVKWLCQQRGSENKNSNCHTKWDNSESKWLPLLQIARLRRCSGKSSSWCLGWRGRLRTTCLQRITNDTVKCLKTAFVDAIDRGHATGAMLQAEHAALDSCRSRSYPITKMVITYIDDIFCLVGNYCFRNQKCKQHIYIFWLLRPM